MFFEMVVGSAAYWLWFRLVTFMLIAVNVLLGARLAEKHGVRSNRIVPVVVATILGFSIFTEAFLGELSFEFGWLLFPLLLIASAFDTRVRNRRRHVHEALS